MNWEEYQEASARTMVDKGKEINILHGIIGISTEAGELLDAYKRYKFYGKGLDITNVGEEIGDIMWYIAILCRELNLDMKDILRININKLKVRFPENFTNEHALNRNLTEEREALEASKRLAEGTLMSDEDRKIFFGTIIDSPPPSKKLKEAAEEYEEKLDRKTEKGL